MPVTWTVEIGPGAGTQAEFQFFTCRGSGDTPEEALERALALADKRIAYLEELKTDAQKLA